MMPWDAFWQFITRMLISDRSADWALRGLLLDYGAKMDRGYGIALQQIAAEDVVLMLVDPSRGLGRSLARAGIGSAMTADIVRESQRLGEDQAGVVLIMNRVEAIEATARIAPDVSRDLTADVQALRRAGHFHVVVIASGRVWLTSRPVPA